MSSQFSGPPTATSIERALDAAGMTDELSVLVDELSATSDNDCSMFGDMVSSTITEVERFQGIARRTVWRPDRQRAETQMTTTVCVGPRPAASRRWSAVGPSRIGRRFPFGW